MAASWWDKIWDPNADQTQLGNRITGQLDSSLNGSAPYYNNSLFTGAGGGTRNAWMQGNQNANGLIRSGGFNPIQNNAMSGLATVGKGYGALGDNNGLTSGQMGNQSALGNIGQGYGSLAGAYAQDGPGYQTVRNNVADTTLSGINGMFNNSGRFGGGSHAQSAGEGLGNALGQLDYGNYQNNVTNRYRSLDGQASIQNSLFGNAQAGVGNQLGALAGQAGVDASQFSMGQQGIDNRNGAIGQLGAIGAAQDANTQGLRMGAADLYDRQHGAELKRLQDVGNVFNGVAGATNNQPAWWQQALGTAASVAPWFAGF